MNEYILAADYTLAEGILASVVYFAIALIVLALSFVVQDLLTPGRLRDQVFVHHLPNAAVMAGSQLIAALQNNSSVTHLSAVGTWMISFLTDSLQKQTERNRHNSTQRRCTLVTLLIAHLRS